MLDMVIHFSLQLYSDCVVNTTAFVDDNAIISRLLLLVEIVVYTSVGRFVRISPNEVSISDPSAVQTIYGIKSKFTKTVWYSVWRNHTAKTKHADQFGDMDEKHHAARRRLLSNMYAMTSILESEPYIDDCTQLFMIKLGEVADGKTSVDLGRLLQLYAFDVIGELYFGSKFGFIEAGRDLQGFVDALEKRMPTSVTLANLPPLWRPLYVRWRALRTAYSQGDTQAWLNLSNVATDNVSERQRLLQAEGNISYFRNGRKDMLTKLFKIQVTKGDKEEFGFYDIVQEGNVGVFAGSDTTAVALRAIVYQVLTHPSVLTRLQNELDTAVAERRLTIPVKYSDANRLPYFCACVKEAMRLHPSVGLQLPRYVPAGGCEIGGHFFPEGMAVGINPAVLHYQTSVFGPDAVEFNPERWLIEDAGTMDRYLLTFGGGSRTCIGKNVGSSALATLP